MPSSEVMHKFKKGQLHSGSKKGPKVKNRKQAIAIKMSEERSEKKSGGKMHDKTPPKSKPQGALWNTGNPPGGRNTAKSRERRLEGKQL